MTTEMETLKIELKTSEANFEEKKKAEELQRIALQRTLDQPYKDLMTTLECTHAIIADEGNHGVGTKVPLQEIMLTEKALEEERTPLPRTELKALHLNEVIISGNRYERAGAQTPRVTLYDEISQLTELGSLRYFRQAVITAGKNSFFLFLKEGQLLQLERVDELVQVIALCLTPPVTLGGKSMLLIVWADPDLDYVS
jgi:hypothetical protein